MRREICGECDSPINDDGACICTEFRKRGWRPCAKGQKTTQWCAEAERVRGELREQSMSQKVVAWARPVYARPVSAPDTDEWDELVDIEFHTRPEKPEGAGWRPLMLADTGDGTPLPRINAKCQSVDNGIAGSAFLKVVRVEQEDDGSLTVVIDHWPQQEAPFTCKYCGQPSWIDPSDQSPPPDYCQDIDHGTGEAGKGDECDTAAPATARA